MDRCDFKRGYCREGLLPCDLCQGFLPLKKTSAKLSDLIRKYSNSFNCLKTIYKGHRCLMYKVKYKPKNVLSEERVPVLHRTLNDFKKHENNAEVTLIVDYLSKLLVAGHDTTLLNISLNDLQYSIDHIRTIIELLNKPIDTKNLYTIK